MKRLIKKLLNKKQNKLHWYLLSFVKIYQENNGMTVNHRQYVVGNKSNYIDLECIRNETNKDNMILLSVSYLGYETEENMKFTDNIK